MNLQLLPNAMILAVVAVLAIAAGDAPRAQGQSGLSISNLRIGEISLDKKKALSIPITVDFEISDGVVTNTIAFIKIEGSKGVGTVCGSGEKSLKSGTLSCTWTDGKFKPPKNKKMLPFTLTLVDPFGGASNSLQASIALPE